VTRDKAVALVVQVLVRVAPDLRPDDVDIDADLQEDHDLDSMDVLNLVIGVAAASGLEIPDRDAAALRSVGAFADYVVGHL
jgi:acyl carrier protein